MQGNKNIPELRFPEFEGEWIRNTLNKVIISFINGKTPSRDNNQYWDGDIPWVSSGELNYNHITQTNEKITEDGQNSANLQLLPKNTFLIAVTGLEASGTRGSCAILDIEATTNQSCMALIPNPKKLSMLFLYYWYLKKGEKYGIKYTQGTKQQSYNIEILKKLPITIPLYIEEQEKIANFLSAIDKKIELMEKEINKQSKYMKKIREIILNDNSDNSNKVQLKEICIINKGKQLNKTNMINDGKYYVLNGGKTPSGFTNSWNVPENTISISEGGNSCGFVNYNVQKFYCGGHCYYLTNISDEIDPLLLYHCLKMNENKIMNLRVGSGLPNIQKKDLEKYKLYIPTKNHEKITYLLNNINLKIDLNKEKLNHLKQFKKGLLQKMFC